MAAPVAPRDSDLASRSEIVKVAAASLIGTSIEWYDFFLYGTAAALVFNKLFFPTFAPLAGTMAAFATYAVGFAARPIGGIVFGHYGDRLGRKTMLYLTLLIMGLATTAIGLLPTYASIGIWAPIALVALRLFQGLGIGGEWGGAVLLTVEHAPAHARGFYGSWPQMGVPAGLLLSTGVFAAFSSRLSEPEFLAWGWRVPFLVSLVLLAISVWLRFKLSESPKFRELQEAGQRQGLRRPPGQGGAVGAGSGSDYGCRREALQGPRRRHPLPDRRQAWHDGRPDARLQQSRRSRPDQARRHPQDPRPRALARADL